MSCVPCNCNKMDRKIRAIIQEYLPTPTPTPTPAPEPRTLTELTGIQAQITNTPGKLLYDKEQMMFNNIIMSNNPNIMYDNGRFNITKSGTYFISWQMATTSMDIDVYVYFTVCVNSVEYASMPSPLAKGHITGTMLINAKEGDYITLINNNIGGEGVMLGHAIVQGNIVIMG